MTVFIMPDPSINLVSMARCQFKHTTVSNVSLKGFKVAQVYFVCSLMRGGPCTSAISSKAEDEGGLSQMGGIFCPVQIQVRTQQGMVHVLVCTSLVLVAKNCVLPRCHILPSP